MKRVVVSVPEGLVPISRVPLEVYSPRLSRHDTQVVAGIAECDLGG